MTRQDILNEAARIVHTDRNTSYGEPEDNFATIAALWDAYFKAANRRPDVVPNMEPVDVAVCMILTKVARIAQSPEKLDHWIDIAGYAACGGQVATQNANPIL